MKVTHRLDIPTVREVERRIRDRFSDCYFTTMHNDGTHGGLFNLDEAIADEFEDIVAHSPDSPYNAKRYTDAIFSIVDEARRHGIKVTISIKNDHLGVEVENTVYTQEHPDSTDPFGCSFIGLTELSPSMLKDN